MKKRFLSLLLVVVLLVTALAGCAQNADGNQGDADVKKDGDVKKVINLALSENITKLDPHDIFNFPVFTACWMMYDTLISTDHEGNYLPCLATEWSHSDDGLVWTFKLRNDVKFQNGEDFDSADVVTTYQRLIDNRDLTCSMTYWPYLQSVEAVDQYTAKITLSEPFGPAELAFSNTWHPPRCMGSRGRKALDRAEGRWYRPLAAGGMGRRSVYSLQEVLRFLGRL